MERKMPNQFTSCFQNSQILAGMDVIPRWIHKYIKEGRILTVKPGNRVGADTDGTSTKTHKFVINKIHDNYVDCLYLTEPFVGQHRGYNFGELFELYNRGNAIFVK
jgi:hypothetical protein